MLSVRIKSSLRNWKFKQAIPDEEEETYLSEVEFHAIQALAELFGNIGHFDGKFSFLVSHIVNDLTQDNKHTIELRKRA